MATDLLLCQSVVNDVEKPMVAERSSNFAYELRTPFVCTNLGKIDDGQVRVGH